MRVEDQCTNIICCDKVEIMQLKNGRKKERGKGKQKKLTYCIGNRQEVKDAIKTDALTDICQTFHPEYTKFLNFILNIFSVSEEMQQEKNVYLCVVMVVNKTYYADHFAVYTYIKSL